VPLFHLIVGSALGLLFLWRVIDLAFGMRKVADITKPEWDGSSSASAPRVTVVVPARNEAERLAG
jgi:cellulose synthase/poly-beta-1,6-N-acetylglucosamine synthase-like glycosyltransferase